MKQLIVGLGRQQTVSGIVQLAEDELQRSQGKPRTIVAHAPGIEIQATRHDFQGPFENFSVKLRSGAS